MKKLFILAGIIIIVLFIVGYQSSKKSEDESQTPTGGEIENSINNKAENAGLDVTQEDLDKLKFDIEGIDIEDLPSFTE